MRMATLASKLSLVAGILALTLLACGGDTESTPRPERTEGAAAPTATEGREATADSAAGRAANTPVAAESDGDGEEPTRPGQLTEESGAADESDGTVPAVSGKGPQLAPFASVSGGGHHTCGVRTDGAVACWGWDEHGQATPPEGEFASVSGGFIHTCGVRTSGDVACWGSNTSLSGLGGTLGQATPPEGEFASVSGGRDHTCGGEGRRHRRLLGR